MDSLFDDDEGEDEADDEGEGVGEPAPVSSPDVVPSNTALVSNATGPQKVMIDGVLTEQHPLMDQIAADRYINSKAAMKQPGKGWRALVNYIRPGGSV